MRNSHILIALIIYFLLTPNNLLADECAHWDTTDNLSEHTEKCDGFESDQDLYKFLWSEATKSHNAADYEKSQVFAAEALRLIASKRESLFQSSAAERVAVNKNIRISGARNSDDSELLYNAFKAASRSGRRKEYLPFLEKAEGLQYPWAYFEFARRFHITQPENAKAKLDEANALGYETPQDIVDLLTAHNEKLAEKNAEKEVLEQAELQRKAEEQRRRDELAAMEIPKIDIPTLNNALHQLIVKSSRISDATLSASTGLPKGFSYRCEPDFCYSIGGLIKFRFVVLNMDKCKFVIRTLAQCKVEWKMEEEVTLNMGNHPGNALLQSMLDLGVTRSSAELQFIDSRWVMLSIK